jgi:hypothetical protein
MKCTWRERVGTDAAMDVVELAMLDVVDMEAVDVVAE